MFIAKRTHCLEERVVGDGSKTESSASLLGMATNNYLPLTYFGHQGSGHQPGSEQMDSMHLYHSD